MHAFRLMYAVPQQHAICQCVETPVLLIPTVRVRRRPETTSPVECATAVFYLFSMHFLRLSRVTPNGVIDGFSMRNNGGFLNPTVRRSQKGNNITYPFLDADSVLRSVDNFRSSLAVGKLFECKDLAGVSACGSKNEGSGIMDP